MYLPDNRTIEILAQVVYKEMCENWRKIEGIPDILIALPVFWKEHEVQTLELARNIVKVQRAINKPPEFKDKGLDVTKTSEIPFNK